MAYNSLFSNGSALICDGYAATMGCVDFKAKETDRITTSQVFFRDLINNGSRDSSGKDLKIPYLVVAGLGPFFEWLDNWKITEEDADYLATLTAPTGERLYPDDYLAYLQTTPLTVKIEAMLEGELAFPDEPVVRLTGPHYQVQLLEAAILNIVTAHTGWATVASQFWLAAQRINKNAALYEFGLRRNPEWGGLGAARSAYLAGWSGTSNLYAGRVYGIPATGTMAHSFIMVRESEIEAFTTWVKHMPYMGVFLPDTYDTIEGIQNTIRVCKEHGATLRGIRLDSGDIENLSRFAREALDAAGFKNAIIMPTDSLNIATIHHVYQVREAPVDAFGVGGNYVRRAQDTGGVAAVMKAAKAAGRELMKFSEAPDKATIPGVQDVIRYLAEKHGTRDIVYDGDTLIPLGMDVGTDALDRDVVSVPRKNPDGLKIFPKGSKFYRPIVPITDENGRHLRPEFQAQDARRVLQEGRARFFQSMKRLDPSHKQILSPRLYGTGIEEELHERRAKLVRGNLIARQQRRNAAAHTQTAAA